MEIRIVTVGKIKEEYLSAGIAEYSKRLGRYCKLTFCQVPDEKTPDKASDALNEQIKDTEGERLMKHIRDQDYVIALAIDGKMLDLTKTEFGILEFLSMHPGQVFDKERIYEHVCGFDGQGDGRGITELIRRIRKKIGEFTDEDPIETVWGVGYRWKK